MMKRFRFQWRTLFIIFGLAVLVLLVRDFNSRMTELRMLTVERDRIAATVTSMAATYVHLETRVAMATSDQLVEEIARESLKYTNPDDHPIVLLEGESVEEEETPIQSVSAVKPVQRWELWLALFMDPAPESGDFNIAP
jgi:cell division protein FtsB